MKSDEFEEIKHAQSGIQKLARFLDTQFTLPGTRIKFGVDFILGLIPGLGDWMSSMLSLYIVNQAVMLGAPKSIIFHMLFNVLIDQLVGSIPLLGDIFDLFWKANQKNAQLIQRFQHTPQKQQQRSLGLMIFIFSLLALIFGTLGFILFQVSWWIIDKLAQL